MVVRYEIPRNWIRYDASALVKELTDAKAAVLALTSIPYQRAWADEMQKIQLKIEVAGTSRIEGADFTERELDAALLSETPEEMLTRSQKQARSAVRTYRWIAGLPDDRPINSDLIREVHARIVTGCDDDHCPPGQNRAADQNVTFGTPLHRGAEGGEQCESAFSGLCEAVQREFRDHDLLIQALALHYHIGAMHPFLDGNGRTARALEALMLQRAGLRDVVFIAMSNYYYDEKPSYLAKLNEVRTRDYDLTPFLAFGLRGIAFQCRRLLAEIRANVSKALFRDVMYDLFNRLRTKRKRVIVKRQIAILNRLLETDSMELDDLFESSTSFYATLQNPWRAFVRDLGYLLNLGAITYDRIGDDTYLFAVRLQWPTEITETEFFERVRQLPKAKTYRFLQ